MGSLSIRSSSLKEIFIAYKKILQKYYTRGWVNIHMLLTPTNESNNSGIQVIAIYELYYSPWKSAGLCSSRKKNHNLLDLWICSLIWILDIGLWICSPEKDQFKGIFVGKWYFKKLRCCVKSTFNDLQISYSVPVISFQQNVENISNVYS